MNEVVTGNSIAAGNVAARGPRRDVDLFGVTVTTCRRKQAVAEVLATVTSGPTTVAFVNLHTANLLWSWPGYRDAMRTADLVFNDGIGAELGFRVLGSRVVEDLPGNLVVPELLAAWPKRPCRVYLLGSTDEVIRRAADKLAAIASGVEVVGVHAGYLSDGDAANVVEAINASDCDVLLVGMGNPKQEEFLARYRSRLAAPLAVAVGGLVDIWGGKLVTYPAWSTKLRCHWLVRLWQEPGRLWRRYLIGGPLFFWRVWRWRMKVGKARGG